MRENFTREAVTRGFSSALPKVADAGVAGPRNDQPEARGGAASKAGQGFEAVGRRFIRQV